MLTENVSQIYIVRDFMLAEGPKRGMGNWYTLRDVNEAFKSLEGLGADLPCPDTGPSASMRALRKERYGSYLLDKNYLHDGIYVYRLRDLALADPNDPDNPPYELGRRQRDNQVRGSVIITDEAVEYI